MNSPATKSRRSFLDLLLRGSLFLWAAAMIGPTLAYIWPARFGAGQSNTASAGALKDFNIGTARIIQAQGKPLLVIRRGEEDFIALSAICTHLGCIVKWDTAGKQILCPCHAAVFAPDGKVVSGPPPSPLAKYDVMLSAGEVMVKL